MSTVRLAQWLTVFVLLINAIGMVTPIINAGDSVTYAALAQHIALHGDWVNLVLDGQDWLDKPHFPFWFTALFFKLGGISAFTYILPGFLFHLLGGYYTYRIARVFYGREAAWLSLLVYVSVYHLMYTSTEVKAETYLTGSIMAASYYWLRYDALSKLKYLLLGALFSAVALMTKGVFTLITISSGLVCMWLYQRQWHKFWSGKWALALVLTLLFMTPELLVLYTQFDAHPEKVVFGRTQVSGIKFFFWDSQFGRFLNSGPIKNTGGTPYYFVLVFLWAFLPWVAVYGAALFTGMRSFTARSASERAQFVYLCGAVFVTFSVFSMTRFQLDYYTVIVYPFVAILCGSFLSRHLAVHQISRVLYFAQITITVLLGVLVFGFCFYVGSAVLWSVMVAMLIAAVAYAYVQRTQMQRNVATVFPVFGVAMLYTFITLMVTLSNIAVSLPYNANKLLVQVQPAPIYVFQLDIVARELGLYNTSPCYAVNDMAELPTTGAPYYLLLRAAHISQLGQRLGTVEQIGQGNWVVHKTGTLPQLLKLAKGKGMLEDIRVVRISPTH